MGNTIVKYGEGTVSVSKEVAEFLETDKKRQAAEGRSDRRHISKSDSETVLSTAQITAFSDPTFESAFKNLCFEKLQSISLIQLVVSIEEKFNIEFESEFLASDNITSINSILNYILDYSK